MNNKNISVIFLLVLAITPLKSISSTDAYFISNKVHTAVEEELRYVDFGTPEERDHFYGATRTMIVELLFRNSKAVRALRDTLSFLGKALLFISDDLEVDERAIIHWANTSNYLFRFFRNVTPHLKPRDRTTLVRFENLRRRLASYIPPMPARSIDLSEPVTMDIVKLANEQLAGKAEEMKLPTIPPTRFWAVIGASVTSGLAKVGGYVGEKLKDGYQTVTSSAIYALTIYYLTSTLKAGLSIVFLDPEELERQTEQYRIKTLEKEHAKRERELRADFKKLQNSIYDLGREAQRLREGNAHLGDNVAHLGEALARRD